MSLQVISSLRQGAVRAKEVYITHTWNVIKVSGWCAIKVLVKLRRGQKELGHRHIS